LEEAENAKSLFEAIGLRVGIAYASKAVGEVHKASGRFEHAYSSFLDARTQFRAVGDARGIAYTLCSVAGLYVEAGDADAAETILSVTSAFFEASGVRLGLGKSRRAHSLLRRKRNGLAPPTDPRWENRDSSGQLSKALEYHASLVRGIDTACRPLGVRRADWSDTRYVATTLSSGSNEQ
jgi:hypothetical protein